jgi:hypothetical protein
MAKKKGKIIQMPLSPENYIRTKARSLTLGDCYITKDWDKLGMANILVVRNHTNGNKTVGLFLVDTFCLGLKDTYYVFNIPDSELREILDQFRNEGGNEAEMIKADYTLVHNIIYGAIDFAAEYGFTPFKDFNLTRYILEEDDENVELMEIGFGQDGKPAIFVGKERHPANIIAQLDKTAGKGNYGIVYEDDDDEFDSDDEDDDEDFENGEYEEEDDDDMKGKPIQEWTPEDFNDIMTGKKKTDITKTLQIFITLYLDSLKKKEKKAIYNKSDELLSWNVVDDEEFEKKLFSSEEEENVCEEIHKKYSYSASEALPLVEKYMIKYPQSFQIRNYKGMCMEELGFRNEIREFSIDTYLKFPNEVIAFCNYITALRATGRENEANILISQKGGLPAIFPSKKEFSIFEYLSFIKHLTIYYVEQNNIQMAIACAISLFDFEFADEQKQIAEQIYFMVTEKLMKYMQEKYNFNQDEFNNN